MLKKRVIPCLDIKDGRTVKGINFVGLQDAGDPITLAQRYVLLSLVEKIAYEINIPFTVGGGIRSTGDVHHLLNAGADKISVNSAAVDRPALIQEIAEEYGSQCLVLAIDTKQVNEDWLVFVHGGKKATELNTVAWAIQGQQLGAGEILLTSMNNDGTKSGFALDILHAVSEQVRIPFSTMVRSLFQN